MHYCYKLILQNFFYMFRPMKVHHHYLKCRIQALWYNIMFCFGLDSPPSPMGHGLLIHEVSRSHATHQSREESSGRVISLSQRPLPYNTQHLQQTNIHAPGGIRNHNLSRRATADLRLRPRGHCDRLSYNVISK